MGLRPDVVQVRVRAVTRHERLRLEGFVGRSFGSVRLAYLNGGAHLAWSVLVRPFPVGPAALRQVRWVRSPVRSHSSLDRLDSYLDQVTR